MTLISGPPRRSGLAVLPPQAQAQMPEVARKGEERAGLNRCRTHKYLVPEVIFGVGTVGEVGNVLRRKGGCRPFIVTDPGVIEAGWVDHAMPFLDDAGLSWELWHGVTPNPKDYEVDSGFEVFRESGCDVVMALGGGSCIDAAKAIAMLSTNPGNVLDYAGIDKVQAPLPPMVMVPSTGGTGADVSQFCVITDTANRLKATIAGRSLVPDVSITDPRLLTTMPDDLSANTALDALAYAIEAYVSKAADFLSDVHALAAIRGISEHLLSSLADPKDLVAREGIARASLQAGMAFSNALLGATHAISHQIGGALDLPHGLLNAILLPHVIRFNSETNPERYVDVSAALGLGEEFSSPRDAADAVASHISLLSDKIGIPPGLAAIGVKHADIDVFAVNALNDAYITTNPRPVSEDDVRRICVSAL